MRTFRSFLIVSVVLMLVPAAAQAKLAFVKTTSKGVNKGLYVAADDGSGAVKIADNAYDPSVSPDGTQVLFSRITSARTPTEALYVVPTAGGKVQRLASSLQYAGNSTVWSADGARVLAVVGPEIGKQTLEVITVAGDYVRTIATGYFSGASFSPDGKSLVYGRTSSSRGTGLNVYVADLSTATVRVTRITSDGVSSSPVWGPQSIVFSRTAKAKRRDDAPKANLFLIQPDGTGRRQLTTVKPAYLLFGLSPTQWSADGSRLLAEFGGQDYSEAWTVDPVSGKARDLTGKIDSIVGYGLSRDGITVLAATGGFEPGPGHNVVAIPYDGGAAVVLARGAIAPSWNR